MLIGITTSIAPSGRYGLSHLMLGAQYVRAVERTGAVVVPLSPAHAAASLERLLDLVDGMVFSGGEDIDPARYGQPPHAALGSVSPERDAMEIRVLEGALRRELPVLAICRGMQLLNVAWGGTLFQDLPSQRPGGVEHRQTAPIHQASHAITLEAGSTLRGVVGAHTVPVNSFHHQGIDRLAEGLRPVAWAEDGLVEGVESTERRWIVGVQWHPERDEEAEASEGLQPGAAIFRALVAAASARSSRS
jgi:putative glutamine amidotransferase